MAITKRYSKQVVVLCKPETHDQVHRLAEEREQSVSAIIRQALEIGLAQIDPQGAQSPKVESSEGSAYAHAA